MSIYTKQHYEDVARLLNKQPVASVGSLHQAIKRMGMDFADLFAADDLEGTYCGYCGDKTEETKCLEVVNPERPKHSFLYHNGFNEARREQFLAACGLERSNG